MDMSMEIDNENTDKTREIIKEYLKGKINEIKFLSSDNETQKCHENCLEILQKSENLESSDLKLCNTWQRVYNNKLIIGICVENSSQRSAENVNVILNSDTNINLTYTTKLYTKYQPEVNDALESLRTEDNPTVKSIADHIENLAKNDPSVPIIDQWIPTQELIFTSTIVIVLKIPQFINFKSFDLQGVLLYEKRNKKFQLNLPSFCLTVEDVTSEKYAIKMNSILNGTDDTYLSMISSSMITSVRIIVPKGIYRKLDGLLQIDCFFTKAEVHSNELFLVYDGNSQCLKDIILKVSREEKESKVDIFTKDNEQLQLLYHHLYSKMPGVVILDKNCDIVIDRSELYGNHNETFMEGKKRNEKPLIQFIESFKSVLIFVEDNFKKCYEVTEDREEIISSVNLNNIGENYKKIRTQLADLEKRADEHFRQAMDEK